MKIKKQIEITMINVVGGGSRCFIIVTVGHGNQALDIDPD